MKRIEKLLLKIEAQDIKIGLLLAMLRTMKSTLIEKEKRIRALEKENEELKKRIKKEAE